MTKQEVKYSTITFISLIAIVLMYFIFFKSSNIVKNNISSQVYYNTENDVLKSVFDEHHLTERNIISSFVHDEDTCYIFVYGRDGSIGTRFLRIKKILELGNVKYKRQLSSSYILPKIDGTIYGVIFCSDNKLSVNVDIEEGDTLTETLPYKEVREVYKGTKYFEGYDVKCSVYEIEHFNGGKNEK